jgi:transcriptional regulator with XRE-family HTH domain
MSTIKKRKPRAKTNWTAAETEYLKFVGENIVKIKVQKKITSNEMCIELEMNKSNFRRIERGETNVSLLLLRRIAKALNVPYQRLIGKE